MKDAYIFISIAVILLVGAIIYFVTKAKSTPQPSPGPGPKPSPPKPPVVSTLPIGKYFSKLFPTGSWSDDKKDLMKKLYLNLDCWYENMLPEYKAQIISALPDFKINRMQNVWNDPPEGIVWEKLFDGSVCDCMRFAYPVCNHPRSRFGGKDILNDCPLWPGLNVGKTYGVLITQAYNTNNASNNFVKDSFTLRGKGKGFPNNSYVEGLSYPGEYGHPDICGVIPADLKQTQPGLSYKDDAGNWEPLNYPYTEGPWFGTPCDPDNTCKVSFLTCKNIKSDGSFPMGQKPLINGNFCIDGSAISKKTVENFEDDLYDVSVRSYSSYINDLEMNGSNDISNIFSATKNALPASITTPDLQGYHGLWLYPLRGVGMWRAIGNSFVCNTKLGYLIAPKPNGLGYKLQDMLTLAGNNSGGPQNVNKQFQRLVQIIQKGYVSKTPDYSAMTLKQLNEHIYGSMKKINNPVKDYTTASNLVYQLMTMWYIDGYNGLIKTDGTLNTDPLYYNGFNYNYQKWFPIGTHFGYASAYDNLVLSNMASNKIDTLQLVMEPQAAKAGLRPGYYFEIFQATPTNKITGAPYSVFTDTSSNQCKSFFMIDPSLDINNYTQYGYINGSKSVEDNKKVFNPLQMTLTAAKISFDDEKESYSIEYNTTPSTIYNPDDALPSTPGNYSRYLKLVDGIPSSTAVFRYNIQSDSFLLNSISNLPPNTVQQLLFDDLTVQIEVNNDGVLYFNDNNDSLPTGLLFMSGVKEISIYMTGGVDIVPGPTTNKNIQPGPTTIDKYYGVPPYSNIPPYNAPVGNYTVLSDADKAKYNLPYSINILSTGICPACIDSNKNKISNVTYKKMFKLVIDKMLKLIPVTMDSPTVGREFCNKICGIPM